jgi:hypothetical protein
MNVGPASIDNQGNFTTSGDISTTLGNLNVQGNQFSYQTVKNIKVKLAIFNIYNYLSYVPGTDFSVALTINKVGNQVTINFPQINFFTPSYPGNYNGFAQNNDLSFQGSQLLTIGDSLIPVGYRPTSVTYENTIAPSGNAITCTTGWSDAQ